MQRLIYWIKALLKSFFGYMYILFLPLIIKPWGRIYHGAYYTFTRIAVLRFLETWRQHIHGKVLDIGAGTWDYPRRLLDSICDYTATDCFEHPNIDVVSDINSLSQYFDPESFDFVLCTEVFEHLPRPWLALRQIFSILKPGGVLLLTTPFNFHIHTNPRVKDYWRFTSEGLEMLLIEEAGFNRIDITSVGHVKFPFSYTVAAYKGK